MLRNYSFALLPLLAAAVTANATMLTAHASAGSTSNTVTSTTYASTSASDYEEDEYDSAFLQMMASASPTRVSANSYSYGDGGNFYLGGHADAKAVGQAMIVGGTGLGYVSFSVWGGAYDGCASFEALGIYLQDCSGNGLDTPDPVVFRYNTPFSYRLSVSAYRDLFLSDLENVVSIGEVWVTDLNGNPQDGARLQTGDFPNYVPEPATFILTAIGVLTIPLLRSKYFRR